MKKTRLVILVLLLLAAPAAMQAQGFGDGFYYNINAGDTNTITITYYTGSLAAVSIPNTINGLTVTGIGNGEVAVFSASLISVTIPTTVTSIGGYAFDDCPRLTGVTFPNSLTSIGDDAFFFCTNLTSVTIPPSVTNIGAGPFTLCTSLPAITVNPSNSAFISTSGVLFNQSQTALIQYPAGNADTSYTIPNSVTNIGESAFDACESLTNVTIPGSVTSIGPHAFEDSGLISVTIPASVTNIGYSAFVACFHLTEITVDTNNPAYSSVNGVLFDKSQTTLIEYPVLPNGNYTIPDGVTNIGGYALAYCNLTSVTLPASVTSINPGAFYDCKSLTAIAVDANNPIYSSINGVWFDKSQTTLIQYPGGLSGSYTIPNGVTSVAGDAFNPCYKLTGVTIPNSVTNIGDYAFLGTSLTGVTIPNSVTSIGFDAFAECDSLTGVYFAGNAPTAYTTAFPVDTGATVYYLPGTTGWSSNFTSRPAVIWNPLIQAGGPSFGVKNNQFGFNITGTNNFTVAVEACTNLASPVWIALQTLTLSNGVGYFSDPQWRNYPDRFYGLGFP